MQAKSEVKAQPASSASHVERAEFEELDLLLADLLQTHGGRITLAKLNADLVDASIVDNDLLARVRSI